MRFLVAVLAVAALAIASSACAGTSLSGSLAGAWTISSEDHAASALSAGLGATYRPDAIVPTPVYNEEGVALAPKGTKIQPSDLAFWTAQYFNDQADMNMTGAGLSIFKAPNFELLGEVGAVFKGLTEEKARVGVVALADIRFTALNQPMAFKAGAGYCDDPILILQLGFETK